MPPAQPRHDLPFPHVPSVVALWPAGIDAVGLALLVVVLVVGVVGVEVVVVVVTVVVLLLVVVVLVEPEQTPKAG